MCPQYMNEIYKKKQSKQYCILLLEILYFYFKTVMLKLFQSLTTKALSQKYLSYVGSFILNSWPDDVKLSNNVSTFKHKVKKSFLTLLREKDQHIYVYYG